MLMFISCIATETVNCNDVCALATRPVLTDTQRCNGEANSERAAAQFYLLYITDGDHGAKETGNKKF